MVALLHCAGPSPCFLIPMVIKGGKAQKNGKVDYMGIIRSRSALSLAA